MGRPRKMSASIGEIMKNKDEIKEIIDNFVKENIIKPLKEGLEDADKMSK